MMFENVMQTRAAICGTGVLLAIIFFLAHLPTVLFIVPVAILFLGIVSDPEETHAVWYGVLATLGIFDPALLADEERAGYAARRHYFWFGEVASAAALAAAFAVPAGLFLAERTGIAAAFTGAMVLFLPLFIFLPKLIRQAMKTDEEAMIALLGKNEQVKRVFWSLFLALAGLVLAQVMEPALARQVVGILIGAGG